MDIKTFILLQNYFRFKKGGSILTRKSHPQLFSWAVSNVFHEEGHTDAR